MSCYRFTGEYKFPPDRGSPHGDTESFVEEFEADNDTKARDWVRAYRSTHVQIAHAKLVKIVVTEQTTPIHLRN